MKKIVIVKDRSTPMLGLHGLDAAFHGLPETEIVALVDSKDEGADEARAICGAKRRYREMGEALAAERPDIVVLCSRHPFDHPEQIRLAARHGCHVFCEKPMAVGMKEADEIVEIVERTGIKLCVAHPGRYSATFRQLKEAADRGMIGKVTSVAAYGKSDHRGGGEDLMTLGTHLLDTMVYVFGPPERVMAEVLNEGRPTRPGERRRTMEPIGPAAGDQIFAVFQFPGGIRGTFESYAGFFRYDERTPTNMGLVVSGSEGVLAARFTDMLPDDPVRFFRTRYPLGYGGEFEELAYASLLSPEDLTIIAEVRNTRHDIPRTRFMMEANRLAAKDLLESIAWNRQPVSNAGNARTTLEMIYGVYASHFTGKTVHFPLKFDIGKYIC